MKAFLFMGLGASLGQNDLLSTDPSNHPTPRDGRAPSFVSKHSVSPCCLPERRQGKQRCRSTCCNLCHLFTSSVTTSVTVSLVAKAM